MLSFNRLGNLGRLGNQMFQYAAIKGIAMHRGFEWCIPPKDAFGQQDEKVRDDINNTIYDVFNLGKFKVGFCNSPIAQEATHSFDKNLYDNILDNNDLLGYYQTHKYFENIEDEIRKDFTFQDDIQYVCKKFFSGGEYISLHIRRGDYLKPPHCDHHPVQSIEYYEKALTYFPGQLPVIIFSDDPEWCKQQPLFAGDGYIVSENNDSGTDLCLMSMCNYHIIANSSMSWWGAWLAKSKHVVAPKNWFDSRQGVDTTDKYLPHWIRL